MALLSIPAVDTHRIDYKNGKITAKRFGTSTDIKFYDGSGAELGFEIQLNAKGYFCDTNGTLYTNGVFLREDATVFYSGPGCNTSWTVKAPIDENINDGKLLDLNGNVVWSANSGNNYTLNYEDLANKPKINEWSESQQDVTITSQSGSQWDAVTVDKYAKILNVNATGASDDGIYRLSLTPEVSNRWGQVITAVNNTASPLYLKNASDDSMIATLRAGESKEMLYLTSQLYVCGQDYWTGHISTTSLGVTDGNRNLFILRADDVSLDYENDQFIIYLLNSQIYKFTLSWVPNNTWIDTPLRVKLVNANGVTVKEFAIQPYGCAEITSYVNGDYADVNGHLVDNVVSKSYTCASAGNAGLSYATTIAAEVDNAFLVFDGLTPAGTSGTPNNVTLTLEVGKFRTKNLKILVANVLKDWISFTLNKIMIGGIEVTVNGLNAPTKVLRDDNWETQFTSAGVATFLVIDLVFLPVGSPTRCLAYAHWSVE